MPMFSAFNNEALIQVLIFGLIGPPVLALITKFIKRRSLMQKKVGNHINLFFMMIAFCLSAGIVGGAYHLIVGLPDQALMPIVFFGAGGFGFIAAYLINPALAYRQNDKS